MTRRGGPPAMAAALGITVLVAGAVTASAAPTPRVTTPSKVKVVAEKGLRARAAASADDDPNQLGPGGLPRSSSADISLTVGLAPSLRDPRAKLSIKLPKLTGVGYLFPRPRLDPFVIPAPRYWQPERPDPSCDYFITDFGADIYVVDIDQPDPDKQGTIRSVGKFPDTTVSALAFGALPLTATLHVSEQERDGKVVPLLADFNFQSKSVPKGTGRDASGGCDPTWEANASLGTVVTGQLNARLSDVRLDGRPVDVGPSCQTASPIQLHLNGVAREDGGNYLLPDQGTLIQAKDRRTKNPANPIQIAPGSRNLTIPPFVGCVGKSGEDLSTLVSNTVSSMDAALAVNQGGANNNYFDPFDKVTKAGTITPPYVNAPVPGK